MSTQTLQGQSMQIQPPQDQPLDFSQFSKLIQPTSTTTQTSPLTSPGSQPFDPKIALVLGQCCTIADLQYKDPKNYPNFSSPLNPPDFKPLEALGCTPQPGPTWSSTPLKGAHNAGDLFNQNIVYPPVGFIVQLKHNGKPIIVVAFRGTETSEEVQADLNSAIKPAAFPFSAAADSSLKLGSVCQQFYDLYVKGWNSDSIQTQVKTYFQDASNNLSRTPVDVYVTGHSLGGAWAVFSALDIAIMNSNSSSKIQISSVSMYSMESPRVAADTWSFSSPQNPPSSPLTFVSKYQYYVPNSYRIVNVADPVPLNPPNSTPTTDKAGVARAHVTDGQFDANAILYCAYSRDSDLGANHSNMYLPYLRWLANTVK